MWVIESFAGGIRASEGGNCWLGYIMHHVPAPVLAVQPTVELAKRFSRQRRAPLVQETPALRERVAPARARDSCNTQLSNGFPGGTPPAHSPTGRRRAAQTSTPDWLAAPAANRISAAGRPATAAQYRPPRHQAPSASASATIRALASVDHVSCRPGLLRASTRRHMASFAPSVTSSITPARSTGVSKGSPWHQCRREEVRYGCAYRRSVRSRER